MLRYASDLRVIKCRLRRISARLQFTVKKELEGEEEVVVKNKRSDLRQQYPC